MMDERLLAVIPARLNSRRFPGKALIPLLGEALIRHVVHRTREALPQARVIVATDSTPIAEAVDDLCEVDVSDTPHPSGSDRVAETWQKIGAHARYVLNVQGDEPCIPPSALRAVATRLMGCDTRMASACVPMSKPDGAFLDPDTVKVVLDNERRALYFSRAPVPFGADSWYRHIGVYGFSSAGLAAFAALPPSTLEENEGLEQLRALEAGWGIAMASLEDWRDAAWPSVNRPEDRERAEDHLKSFWNGWRE